MRLPPILRGSRTAFIFLTRIPVGGQDYRDADWRWSTAWFPAVGAFLGLALAFLWLAIASLGSWVSAFLVLGVSLLLTGGFHEDGLADTADAMGGAYDRDRLLEILKDSRVGAFGAMALFVSLGLKVALLARLDTHAPTALVVTECLSRVTPIWLMVGMPYVTNDAQSRSRQVTRAGFPQLVFATAIGFSMVGLGWWFGYLTADILLGLTLAMTLTPALCAWRFYRRTGGITGDFLGATQQLTQLALLIAFAAVQN
ncbi:MAG: adenosylcobinamide-GDP ribazoletransferase [Myxococcota bacterium]|nr:adenosylcobinamide-GDP ribazoletransferase [Myxococcota bacterium]